MASKVSNSNKKPFICEHCGSGFSQERTFFKHICKKKRRALQKNEKRVQLGFNAFNRFYELSMHAKEPKTYDEFCSSKYYNAFVRFGSYLSNVNPLYPDQYLDYLIREGIKISKWCDDEVYDEYASRMIRKESVETALERSIHTMVEWSESCEHEWYDYFRKVSKSRAVWNIRDGKVSPWLVLNCASGKALMASFSDEQLQMVYAILDPKHWGIRFARHKSDVNLVKDIAKKAGL